MMLQIQTSQIWARHVSDSRIMIDNRCRNFQLLQGGQTTKNTIRLKTKNKLDLLQILVKNHLLKSPPLILRVP
jgi:hypothetical protein